MKDLLKPSVIINAALFQALWFACVIGSANKLIWPAVMATIILMAWQLHPKRRHSSDLKLLTIAICLGLLFDSIWVLSGLLEFTDQRPLNWLAPGWILLMWAGFALTINHSLAWVALHPLLAPLMGFIFGPLAYLAGLRLGAVEYLASPVTISLLLGVAWAISMTVLVKISAKNSLQTA